MLAPNPKPIIYLAGKIGKDDWRTQIFGSRFGAVPTDGTDQWGFDRLLDPTLTTDCGAFRYGGPFFISCDHGCAHGPGTHGASEGGCLDGVRDHEIPELREKILRVNWARIERADLIFAYINEVDCFGTLSEIGYAAALKKPIAVAFGGDITPAQLDDLWMARGCHNIDFGRSWRGGPAETFVRLLCETGHAK